MADTYNISLRMPMELGEAIAEISKTDKRGMNTTIILLLEYALRVKNSKRKKSNSEHHPTNPR